MSKFYAQPYSTSAQGFYFSSPEGFAQKSARNIDPGSGALVEEYSIEFIDGPKIDAHLFEALSKKHFISPEAWYEDFEPLGDDEKAALAYLVDDLGYDLDDAFNKADDVRMFEGSPEDYAHELLDDIGVENINTPEAYFDYEAFGRDIGYDLDPDDEGDEYYLSLSDKERGEEYVDSMGGVGELGKQTLANYFDYEAFARDMVLGGDVNEFDFAGTHYVVTNANEF